METYTKKDIEEALVAIGFSQVVRNKVLGKFSDDNYTLGAIKTIWETNNYPENWLLALSDELNKKADKQARADSDANYAKMLGEYKENDRF